MTTFVKDPDAVLDYAFDWTDWLAVGETISSYTVTVESGITKDSDSKSGGVIMVWLSGGVAGTSYNMSCLITTSAGRTDERSMEIDVQER